MAQKNVWMAVDLNFELKAIVFKVTKDNLCLKSCFIYFVLPTIDFYTGNFVGAILF